MKFFLQYILLVLILIKKTYLTSFIILKDQKVALEPFKVYYVYDKLTCLAYCSKYCSDNINLGLSGCSIRKIDKKLIECNLYSKFTMNDIIQDDNYISYKMKGKYDTRAINYFLINIGYVTYRKFICI